jgi:hypothetical protein
MSLHLIWLFCFKHQIDSACRGIKQDYGDFLSSSPNLEHYWNEETGNILLNLIVGRKNNENNSKSELERGNYETNHGKPE